MMVNVANYFVFVYGVCTVFYMYIGLQIAIKYI